MWNQSPAWPGRLRSSLASARRPAVWRQMDLNPETALAMPGPDPSALRLSRWVNAYRSGDYIGRYLWLQDADARRFHPGVRAAEDRHCDLCIGAGAHTHYWDSAEIGRELDDLIAVAVRRGASTGGPATPGGDAELPTSKDPA